LFDTIREFEHQNGPNLDHIYERPDDPFHYQKYPAKNALDVIDKYLNYSRTLKWIPAPDGGRITKWDENLSHEKL